MSYSVQEKVRPYAEIIEVSGHDLQVAAIVYGGTKREAVERARLLSRYLRLEATPEYIRKRLRMLAWYRWLWLRADRSKDRLSIWSLMLTIMGCFLEPKVMGRWLATEYLNGPTPNSVSPAEDVQAFALAEEDIL